MGINKLFGIISLLIIISISVLFVGCGGGGGSGNTPSEPESNVTVSGVVLDSSNIPVSSATVTINSDPIVVSSDTSGRFSADVPPGNHSIIITKDDTTFYQNTFTAVKGTPLSLGNLLPTTPYYVNGKPNSDTQAPTAPVSITASATSSSQINLSWSSSTDNIGVTGYNVYRGGAFIKQVTSTSTSDIGLPASTQYCYTVSAVDAAGNCSSQSTESCATTNESNTPPTQPTPPIVISTSPSNGASGVTIDSVIRVTFSKNINQSTITTSTFLVSSGGTSIPGILNCLGAVATFIPSSSLSLGTTYTVTLTTGVKDLAANALATNYTWTFTTSSTKIFKWMKLKKITAGYFHTLAIKSDGSLWGWGSNDHGQLGDGTVADRWTPKNIGSDTNWISVSSGYWHNVAIKSDGSLWAWGYNNYGQLGDGTTSVYIELKNLVPKRVGNDSNWASVATGHFHTMAIKSDGSLWGWGYNYMGQLGDGTLIDKLVPTRIGTETDWAGVAAGDAHTVAIKTDGSLWTWGYNYCGQLGYQTATYYSSIPTCIGIGERWAGTMAGVCYTLAIKTDGSIWACGRNLSGQLGDGTTTDKTVFTMIGNDTNWVEVTCGIEHTVAKKSDGSLWSWGDNFEGCLGDGTQINKSAPVRINNSIDWIGVIAGGAHALAIKSDGSLWGWGYNYMGQLGDGTNLNRLVPTRIGSDTNWQW